MTTKVPNINHLMLNSFDNTIEFIIIESRNDALIIIFCEIIDI